jgi:hypothetical protein
MGIQETLERKFFILYVSTNPFPLQLQENIFLSLVATKHIVTEIQSAFGFLRVHGEFEYCNLISSYSGVSGDEMLLGNDEIERQLKCKICDMGLCILRCSEQ